MRKIELMHARFGKSEHKCRECCHFGEYMRSKKYFKCAVYGLSASEATDWRANYQACGLFNTQSSMQDIYKTAKPDVVIAKGQLSLF